MTSIATSDYFPTYLPPYLALEIRNCINVAAKQEADNFQTVSYEERVNRVSITKILLSELNDTSITGTPNSSKNEIQTAISIIEEKYIKAIKRDNFEQFQAGLHDVPIRIHNLKYSLDILLQRSNEDFPLAKNTLNEKIKTATSELQIISQDITNAHTTIIDESTGESNRQTAQDRLNPLEIERTALQGRINMFQQHLTHISESELKLMNIIKSLRHKIILTNWQLETLRRIETA